MNKRLLFFLFLISLSVHSVAQPFADILNFNYQTFSTSYADSSYRKNITDDYFLNFFLPKELKSGNTLLVRLNTEMLCSTVSPDSAYTSKLYSVSLPLGMKFLSKNKKWETIVIGIPKIASDLRDKIEGHDLQYGGIFLEQFVKSPKLKIKAGLYYNREAFGNFYVPLVAVDWKINKRIYMYGVLPQNYKLEFNLLKNRLYTGLNLKYFTRSFRLSKSDHNDYVRYDEGQVKLFLDYFAAPKMLLYAEAGYCVATNPIRYKYGEAKRESGNISWNDPVYTPAKRGYMLFSVGLAYRIRFDLEDGLQKNLTPAVEGK
ncbi:MAG: hypothetical protein ACJ77K_17075 [Bacteroidia bacterium]